MSDAAMRIFTLDAKTCTGNAFIDDEVLMKYAGMSAADLEQYSVVPGARLAPDFFLDEALPFYKHNKLVK
jgi:citronellol/citronellal dehydrogenase